MRSLRLGVSVVASSLLACGAVAPRASTPTSPAPRQPEVACPNEEVFLASLPDLERRARESLRTTCVPGPGGRWELELAELASGPLSEERDGGTGQRITGRAALAFVDASDRRLVGTPRAFEVREAEDWWSADRIEPRGHFDLDGDGLEELFVWVGHDAYEATSVGEIVVMTVRDGGVIPYAPASVGVPIHAVEDVDADGRPDLVSCTPYCGTSPWGASPVPAGGPPNEYRSLEDGTFSNTDPVVMSRVREACPAFPTQFLPESASEEGYVDSITAVSCARIHGASTEEIVGAIRQEHASGRCHDEGWSECAHLVEELVRHASLTPAHHLP